MRDVVVRDSKYNDNVTVVILDEGDTEVSVWCSPTGLREMIEQANPQPGEYLSITYEGSTITKKGHTLKFYAYEKLAV